MGQVTAGNIVVGLTKVEFGTDGSEDELGATRDGATVRVERGYHDVYCDQRLGRIKVIATQVDCQFETVLEEISLANMRYVWDQAAANLSGSTLTVKGSSTSDLRGELSLLITGTGPDGSVRVVDAAKTVAVGAGDITFQREENAVQSATFNVVQNASNGNFFTVTDT